MHAMIIPNPGTEGHTKPGVGGGMGVTDDGATTSTLVAVYTKEILSCQPNCWKLCSAFLSPLRSRRHAFRLLLTAHLRLL